jgi:hypothetical protein
MTVLVSDIYSSIETTKIPTLRKKTVGVSERWQVQNNSDMGFMHDQMVKEQWNERRNPGEMGKF